MNKIFPLLFLTLFLSSCFQEDLKDLQIKKTVEVNPNEFVGKHKAEVMILGVFHFHKPALDSYKSKFSFDILNKKRQNELAILLNKIEKYKPTKILIEQSRIKSDSSINMQYSNYLNNEFSIKEKKNEIYQIAFRLGEKLNHSKIFCSDASADWFGVKLDWENYDEDAYLKSLGHYEKAKRYDYNSIYELGDSLKTTQTLTEHLIWENNPKNRLKDHQAYLTETILIGAGDSYLGADSLGKWYRRNLRIFANTYDFTNFDEEERILLIYGYGHVWQLSQLFKQSPDYKYTEVNDYLKK
jgi:hypothetical protein